MAHWESPPLDQDMPTPILNLGLEIEMHDLGNSENKPKTPSTGDNVSLKNNVSFDSNGTREGKASFNLFGEPHVH